MKGDNALTNGQMLLSTLKFNLPRWKSVQKLCF